MDGATPKSKRLASRAAKNVSGWDQTVPHTATRHALAPPDGSTGDAPTPFYDHWMSMIEATALENRRAAQRDDDDVVPPAHRRWPIHPLIPSIAGLIVVAVAARVFLVPALSQRQPPIVTADAHHSPEERSPVVDKAATQDKLAETTVPAIEPDSLEPTSVEGKRTGIAAEPVAAAKSDERNLDAAEQPIENLTREQPPPANARLPWAIETGAVEPADGAVEPADGAVEPADGPPAIRIARAVSDVKLRAGPGNGQPVVATISRGTSVEVINCRAWCEVIFAGQRGWVYKSYLGGSSN
jgi:Bacterial SH3 domain